MQYEPIQVFEGDGVDRGVTPILYKEDREFVSRLPYCSLIQFKQGKIEEFCPFLFDTIIGDDEGLKVLDGGIYFNEPYTACIESQIQISTDTIGSEIFASLFDSINQTFVGNSTNIKFSSNTHIFSSTSLVTGDLGRYSMSFHKRQNFCSEFKISGTSFLKIDYSLRKR
jgi:hypothetical protein